MRHKVWCLSLLCIFCSHLVSGNDPIFRKLSNVLRKGVLKNASWALTQQPLTVTANFCDRSAGGLHDFFSEGDYWWPDPANPNGPYIQRDGLTNPENFTAHRKAMIRFSQIMGYLTSAYLITGDEKYLNKARLHLKAWFIDTATMMNPSLLYAQAIRGKVTGRGIGIIDMIQMMEVAQSVRVMENASLIDKNELDKIKNWFSQYLNWVTTHKYGIEERDTKNNHATCWVMQTAVFAKLVDNELLLEDCRQRFRTILLPGQMDNNGSFPLELKRTKPYGYSLFNLDAMATICHVLSSDKDDLWDFVTNDGRSIRKAIDHMYPFVHNKTKWTYPPDVMYWNDWPVAQAFLAFGYKKYEEKKWLRTWKRLDHFPVTEEIIRNMPIRNPLIWMVD